MTKPKQTKTRHPAKFSNSILIRATEVLLDLVPPPAKVLDPFAGTGKGITELVDLGYSAVGVELELEWARQGPNMVVGDARFPPFAPETFDAAFTSPCYGNRMSDHFEARDASQRHTYTHAIGRRLTEGNAGELHWGPDYRILHSEAWGVMLGLLKPGGWAVLNIGNHIRKGQEQLVVEWHLESLLNAGMRVELVERVGTPRLRHGENAKSRVEGEMLMVLKKV